MPELTESVDHATNVQRLQNERDALVLQHEIRTLKESEKLQETVGDYIDPRWILQDPALNASALVPASYIGDRRGGMNWPIFRTEWELNTIRGTCRLLADTSVHAQAVMENLANYVIGKGFTYRVVPREDQTVGPRTIKKAQQVIAEFVDENDYWDLEREVFRRDLRDGEDFLHVGAHDDNSGHAWVRTIEPEYVTESGHNYGDPLYTGLDRDEPGASWMFGVHTRGNDTTQVLGYNVYLDSLSNADYLRKEEMIHTKCNVDRIIKRGLSDFYPTTQNVDQARKLIRNMADGAALQASIAFIRQFQKGTQQGAIQAFNTKKTDFQTARYSINQPQQMNNVQRMEGGRIINTVEGVEYLHGPMGSSNAPNYSLVVQVILRAIGVRWCMPEAMISGDASNANFASSLVAEAPFALCVQHKQQLQGNRHRKVMLRVLKLAALAGRFNRLGLGWGDLKQLIDVQAVATAAIGRNKKEETDRRLSLIQSGILSTDTARSEEGYDESEKEKVEQERDEKKSDPDAAVADQGMPGQEQDGENKPGQQKQGLAGQRGYLGEANDKHDSKTGEFASGGGGSSHAKGKSPTIDDLKKEDSEISAWHKKNPHDFDGYIAKRTALQHKINALQKAKSGTAKTPKTRAKKAEHQPQKPMTSKDLRKEKLEIEHWRKQHPHDDGNFAIKKHEHEKHIAQFMYDAIGVQKPVSVEDDPILKAARSVSPFRIPAGMKDAFAHLDISKTTESHHTETSRAALIGSLATCQDLPEATRAVLNDFCEAGGKTKHDPKNGEFTSGSGGGGTATATKSQRKSEKTATNKHGEKSGMAPATRVGKGKDAKIVDENGNHVSHVKASMIPPAWTEVHVATDPHADVLVKARDSKGRIKTVYSDSHTMKQAAEKFSRIHEFMGKRDQIAGQIESDRKSKDHHTREAADCLFLIQEQGTRPGSNADTKAKVKAYGATTLRAEHVKTEGGVTRLDFIGKEGVHHDHTIHNPKLAKMLRDRASTATERGGNLFDTDDSKLREYTHKLGGGGFTPKDFRTARATSNAISEINKIGKCCQNKKEYQKAVLTVATNVSRVLGNRPKQALESYINPAVFTQWRCPDCA